MERSTYKRQDLSAENMIFGGDSWYFLQLRFKRILANAKDRRKRATNLEGRAQVWQPMCEDINGDYDTSFVKAGSSRTEA